MKRIFCLFLLFVAYNVSAIEINSKLSGVWWNADQSGHGLNVVVLDESTTVVFWYVYHTDGTPMFLITVGQNTGDRVTGKTYYNTGMKFGDFDPNDIQETQWGTSTVTFSDCNTATLQYSSSVPGFGSGTIPMTKSLSVKGLKCSDSRLHGTYFGAWTVGGEVGYGIATLFENGYLAFGAGSDSSEEVSIGEWRVTGDNSFAFTATTYSVLGGLENISGNGNFNEDALTATYSGNGEFVATPVPSFQHSLNTSKMAGTYNVHDSYDAIIGSATVLSDGSVNGSTLLGCAFDGLIDVPNTNFNQAILDVTVSNCGDTTRIVGAAVFNDPQMAIVVAATDGWYGYVWTLKRK